MLRILIVLDRKDRFIGNVRYAYETVLLTLLDFGVSSSVHDAATDYKASIVYRILHDRLMMSERILVFCSVAHLCAVA